MKFKHKALADISLILLTLCQFHWFIQELINSSQNSGFWWKTLPMFEVNARCCDWWMFTQASHIHAGLQRSSQHTDWGREASLKYIHQNDPSVPHPIDQSLLKTLLSYQDLQARQQRRALVLTLHVCFSSFSLVHNKEACSKNRNHSVSIQSAASHDTRCMQTWSQ